MNKRRGDRPNALLFTALGVVAATAQVSRLLASNQLGRSSLFVDDAYYYFEIARNIARGNGSTWDGLHTTNGYHPLWMVMLLPVVFVVRDRVNVLVTVKAVAGLLWIVAMRSVARIANILNAPTAMWIGALPIVLYSTLFARSTPFAGVETGLLIPISLTIITVLLQPEHPKTIRNLGWLGAAATLTRLDALTTVLTLSVVVGLHSPTPLRFRERITRTLRVGAPAVVSVISVAVINRIWTGELLTVSSRAKALGGGTSSHYALRQYFTQPGSLPIFVGIGSVTLLVTLVALYVTHAKVGAAQTSPTSRHLARVLGVLWLAEFSSTIVFDSQSSWPQWPWYFYNSFIILLLAPGLVLSRLWPSAWSLNFDRAGGKVQPRATALLLFAAATIGIGMGWATAPRSNGTENFYTQSAKGAAALDATLPRDAVIAMGDRAGAFGYFVNRPVVQLEGIVNSHEFLDAVERGESNQFLQRAGVTYYAKSAHLEDRYPLENDGGPEPEAKQCGWRFEPFFGESDKLRFAVCKDDIVYTATSANGEQLTVWRLTQPVTRFAMPPRSSGL